MKKIMLLAGFAVVTLGLTSCANTFDGAGRDIEDAGQSIQRTF